MSYGPADLYVLELPAGSNAIGITEKVKDVTAAGVITLLDVALVSRAADGSRTIAEYDELAAALGLSHLSPGAAGLIGEDDLLELTQDMAPGATALAVLVENTWARQIATAVQTAQAKMLASTRFPAEVVNEVAALAGTTDAGR